MAKGGRDMNQNLETYEILAREKQEADQPLIVAVKCGNILKELNQEIDDLCDLTFVDLSLADGVKIYQRSLTFLMIRAAMSCFEGIKVKIQHALSKGIFCELEYSRRLTHQDFEQIEAKMKQLVMDDIPFKKMNLSLEEATEIFTRQNMDSKVALLKYREEDYIPVYECDQVLNYFYGYMVPSTGYIKQFKMIKYGEGMILMHPTVESPMVVPAFVESPKIAEVFKESNAWTDILNISYVSNLNDVIQSGEYAEIIQVAEALHEKKIAYIADEITRRNKRVVLIAGPSSSGKTTFANRLRIQLKVNGLHPVTLSTDNYFVDRQHTPLDEEGNFDFESLKAVDVKLFNEHLNALLEGEEVELPTFNFQEGKREYRGNKLSLDRDQPIIIEGIHGLNDALTEGVYRKDKFKIYVSALTPLNIDEHNRIPTTQTRLLRRIVRDHQFRGHDAKRTIGMWPSVRRGEERNIYPFQEKADEVFNTALPYEFSILKKHALPLLESITPDEAEYPEALMLKKFLTYFVTIEEDNLVPSVSILKEFIGGSGFEL